MMFTRKAITAFLVLVFMLSCAHVSKTDRSQERDAWRDITDGKLVIDVRRPDEFTAGHLENAINIPHTEIKTGIAAVTKDKQQIIVLYCRSGRRSQLALETLNELGYKNAYNAGGYQALLQTKPKQ
jgi:phage shock protein E